MKIELVDIVVAALAIFFLAAYARLGAAAFLYVVVLLIAAEIVVLIRFRDQKEVKQPESMQ